MPKLVDMKSHFINLLDSYFNADKNRSMRSFAKIVGVSEGTIRNWREGKTTPNIEHLQPLANAMDITIFELLGIDEDGYLAPEDLNLISLNTTNEKFQELVDYSMKCLDILKLDYPYIYNCKTK